MFDTGSFIATRMSSLAMIQWEIWLCFAAIRWSDL